MLKKHLKRLYGDDSIIPIRTAFWSGSAITAGKVIAFLASFAVFSALGRYVPREVAGSYNYIFGALTIMSLATLPGMNNALVRSVARGYENGLRSMMHKRIHVGLLGSLVSVGIGMFFLLSDTKNLGLAFIVAAPFIPFTDTFSNFAVSYWRGKKMFGRSALANIVYYVGLAALSIPLMMFSNNLVIIVGGVLIAQTIMGLIIYRRPHREANNKDDVELSTLGVHLTAMQALQVIANNVDRIITWTLLGPVATAIYTFASVPVSKAHQLIPIGAVSLPHLSQHTFTARLKSNVVRQTLLLLLISVPSTMVVVFIAPLLYKIFFPLYPESIVYFQLLFLPVALSPILLFKFTLTAMNKTSALYIQSIVPPVIKIGAMAGLIIPFGLLGVIAGSLIGSFVESTLLTILFLREPVNE